jgi:hypothetical protein
MKTKHYCLECGLPVSEGLYTFSQHVYGHSLCMRDLYVLEESGIQARVIDLYLALKSRKFPLELGHFDGYRRVDMAIPDTLYIEITGSGQDEFQEILSELMGTSEGSPRNIPSVVIPAEMLEKPLSFQYAVEEIAKVCRMMQKKPLLTSIAPQLSRVQLQ